MGDEWRYYGNSGLLVQPDWTIEEDRTKLRTGTINWMCRTEDADLLAPKIGAAHPYKSGLDMERRTMSYSGPWVIVTGYYAGIAEEVLDTDPVYDFLIGVSEEPIETHPNFVSSIGGTADDPLNEAIFDDAGIFLGFPANAPNDLGGVRSYLNSGQCTWRKTWNSKTQPVDATTIGDIDVPEGSPPTLGAGRNWVYYGMQFTLRGKVYQITKEWRASGRKGWNSIIY